MSERVIDTAYLAYQYGDSEKLRIRVETHERYSERQDDWAGQVLSHLAPTPGSLVLDVGCGPGSLFSWLARAGVQIAAFDLSAGMAREARQRVVEQQVPARLFRADAQRLPLADASCDFAVASHVFFHIPDVPRALRELRRVVRPGGRVLLTANAADHSMRLYELHCRAARDLGLTPTGGPADLPFTLDHLPQVRSVFPRTEQHRWPNAFVFPSAEPALRFYASGRVDAIRERQSDGSHCPALLERVGRMIEEIIAEEGAFRMAKDTGCFVATV